MPLHLYQLVQKRQLILIVVVNCISIYTSPIYIFFHTEH